MKNVALMLAVVAALGLVVGTVLAEGDAPKTEVKSLYGKVTKVADDKGVLEVTPLKQGEKAEPVKVATNDKTAVTIDGKEAKLADLKEGMPVKITPAEGTAAKIDAKTPKAPGGENKPKDGTNK